MTSEVSTCAGPSGKDFIQFLPNIAPVENFDTGDFPGDDIQYQHPFLGCQGNIPMTGTVGTIGFGFRVERGADVIPARAPLENSQALHLSRQFVFALLDEELPKLGCKCGERVSERRSFFSTLIHGISLEQLWNI